MSEPEIGTGTETEAATVIETESLYGIAAVVKPADVPSRAVRVRPYLEAGEVTFGGVTTDLTNHDINHDIVWETIVNQFEINRFAAHYKNYVETDNDDEPFIGWAWTDASHETEVYVPGAVVQAYGPDSDFGSYDQLATDLYEMYPGTETLADYQSAV